MRHSGDSSECQQEKVIFEVLMKTWNTAPPFNILDQHPKLFYWSYTSLYSADVSLDSLFDKLMLY